jgi:EF-hand domain pair/Protein tyrosine and serine/threonine kinase
LCNIFFVFHLDSAFGIMMWELLSGKIPFVKPGEEPSPMNILVRIAGGERPDLRDVRGADKDLVDLMQACWAQDPKKRPSMRHVVDALSGRDPVAIFREVDSNNDKELDFHEFSDFLKRYAPGKVHPAQIYDVFSAIDVNKDGSINLEEFQEFWRQVDTFGLEKALFNCQAGQQGPMNNEDVRHWINS